MHVARYAESLQTLEQLGREVEIRLVDEFTLGFKGIASVANAIENGARLEAVEDLVAVAVHQQVDHRGVALGHAIQTPSRCVKDSAEDVVATGEQRAQQIRPQKSAGAQHQDRSLQAANPFFQSGVAHGVSASSLRMEDGSSPDSCRW